MLSPIVNVFGQILLACPYVRSLLHSFAENVCSDLSNVCKIITFAENMLKQIVSFKLFTPSNIMPFEACTLKHILSVSPGKCLICV